MSVPDNPQFLGSELLPSENQPSSSFFQILPCPLEKTVSYGVGTAGGPAAIISASQELERGAGETSICQRGIYTQASINCLQSHREALFELRDRVASILEMKQFPIVLGGEHSLTWGALQGVSQTLGKEIGILQIDAHADLRKEYQGNPHSHASVMRLLVEQGFQLACLGVRALDKEERIAREEYEIFSIDGEEIVRKGISQVKLPANFPQRIYLTLDLDALDPSILPSVGTPVPGGLSYYQTIDLISSALDGRTCIGMDVVELSPVAGEAVSPFTTASIMQRILELI